MKRGHPTSTPPTTHPKKTKIDKAQLFCYLDPLEVLYWSKNDMSSFLVYSGVSKPIARRLAESDEFCIGWIKECQTANFSKWLENIIVLIFTSVTSADKRETMASLPTVERCINKFVEKHYYRVWDKAQIVDHAIRRSPLTLEELNECRVLDGKTIEELVECKVMEEKLKLASTFGFSEETALKFINYCHQFGKLTIPRIILLTEDILKKGREKQILDLNGASRFMEFIGREQLGKIVLPNIKERVEKGEEGTKIGCDKTKSPIMVFATSPGTGKTRNAMEAIESLKEVINDDDSLKEYVDVKIEFYLQMGRNGMGLHMYKSDLNTTAPEYVDRFFAIRLCYLFSKYFTETEFVENEWDEFTTVEIFCRWLKEEHFSRFEKCTIVIVIDEFQKLNSDYKNLQQITDGKIRESLDVSLNIFGTSCVKLANENILLIPIFSGLSYTPIATAIRKLTHPIRHIHPVRSRMSVGDILQFLNKFISECPEQAKNLEINPDNLLAHSELSNCLNRCCGVPRLIEYMLNAMEKDQQWKEVISTIQSRNLVFTEFSSIIDKVFSFHLTKTKIKNRGFILDGNTIEHLEDCGCISLEKEGKYEIVQPMLPFYITMPTENTYFKSFIHNLQNVITQKGAQHLNNAEFENFNASFEFARLTAYRLMECKKVLFRKYFKGMIPTTQLLESKLWTEGYILLDEFNMECQLIKSSDPTVTKGHHVFGKTKNKKDEDRMCTAIIEYSNGIKVETKIIFQDRGTSWNMQKEIYSIALNDIKEEIDKNKEVTTSWIDALDENNQPFKHPSVIMVYFGLKAVKELFTSLQPTKQKLMQEVGVEPIYQYPLMVIGNHPSGDTNNLEIYYGKPIYHAMFRLSLPKIVH